MNSRGTTIGSTSEFGHKVRARRKELGLTQAEVADVVPVNRRVLGRLERGIGTVRLEIALEITRVLGLDLRLEERR